MESASVTSQLPLPKDLRPKQVDVIRAFEENTQVVAKLPTGYGKTRAAAGAFAVLRRQSANRLLYLVPRRNQATQAAAELPAILRADYGIDTKSIVVGDHPVQALRSHRAGSAEIFVATIQSLMSQGTRATIASLCETGRWFITVDEHHHYSDSGQWAESIRALPSMALLAMSATPNRHDGSDFFPDPSIEETYYDASKIGYVKPLTLHAYEYSVDAVTVDGQVTRFSTADIVEQAGGDSPEAIDRYVATQKMRWSPKYISPLVLFPFDRINGLRVRGIRSQMLIQAMSCSHARMVCEQVKTIVGEYTTVDWVGTGESGRSDEENREVLERFCPPKNPVTGQREWSLDILVNVGMAGEGLDTTDVTEVVFLTPANITISNLQTMGRGARVMKSDPDLKCHINVDTASPMGKYVGPKVMELFDEDVEIDDEPPEPRERSDDLGDYEELPEKLTVYIADVTLIDIKQEPMYQHVHSVMREHQFTDEQAQRFAEKAVRDYLARGSNQSAVIAQKQQQVDAAVRVIAGLVVRLIIAKSGMRPDRTIVGDLKKRINRKKKSLYGPVQDASDEELDAQYRWLKSLELEILSSGVPQWLR